jgi:hypothetical protein
MIENNAYRILEGNAKGKEPPGRSNIDGRVMLRWPWTGCCNVDCIVRAHVKGQFRALVNPPLYRRIP